MFLLQQLITLRYLSFLRGFTHQELSLIGTSTYYLGIHGPGEGEPVIFVIIILKLIVYFYLSPVTLKPGSETCNIKVSKYF